MGRRRRGGWIELICGPMFSGKTEELIRRVRRAEIARLTVLIFTSSLDERYGGERVASHSGLSERAIPVENSAEIVRYVRRGKFHPRTTVVGIDEAQFLGGIADAADWLADAGFRVIVAGLDQDFRGQPFNEDMMRLMVLAEEATKLAAICAVCGKLAHFSQRLIDDRPARWNDPVIMVGAAETYQARCRWCHLVPGKPRRRG